MGSTIADKVTAQVLLPRPFDRGFTYAFDQAPALGAWVKVPFGPSTLVGVVWDLQGAAVNPAKLKEAQQILPAAPMPAAQRALVEHLATETMMTRGEALRLALPPHEALDPKASEIRISRAPAPPEDLPANRRPSPGQQRLVDLLQDGEWERGALLRVAQVSPAVLNGLLRKGIAVRRKVVPEPAAPRLRPRADLPLNAEQTRAAAALTRALAQDTFAAFLLDGVTGSGKTHVYFAAMAAALRDGKQVLWLLPEIALTDQLRVRFADHFGQEPLIWHAQAGAGAKARTWRLAASGIPCVVLGARSALHCNFANLGLIIVDEEHEQALKQADLGSYHARDMAEHRARLSRAVFVAGSATPSLESEWRARQGQLIRLLLRERFDAAQVPELALVDLRDHPPKRGRWLSSPLIRAVQDRLDRGEQALLFLNRRGYAPLSICADCGHRLECQQCSAWLVEHRFFGELHCHLCGQSAPKPPCCPACAAEDSLIPCGPGIERLMEEATRTFPRARIAVFSSDTLRTPEETRTAFAAVQSGALDLLVGTQVLAKGLDFPNLTLVGAVDADLGLSNEDLRAGERTFQLLHQVTGRAGRGGKPGRALIQTRAPDSDLMQALVAHDRQAFYDGELRRRQGFAMPPFSRLAALMIAHENPETLAEVAHSLAKRLPQAAGVEVWGPSPARLPLVRGWHRKRFVVRVPLGKRPQSFMAAWLRDHKFPAKARVTIDIDPLSFT